MSYKVAITPRECPMCRRPYAYLAQAETKAHQECPFCGYVRKKIPGLQRRARTRPAAVSRIPDPATRPPTAERRRPRAARKPYKPKGLPVGPLRRWLRDFVIRHEGMDQAARDLGIDARILRRVLHESEGVSLGLADRMLVAAGDVGMLNELYPLEGAEVAA